LKQFLSLANLDSAKIGIDSLKLNFVFFLYFSPYLVLNAVDPDGVEKQTNKSDRSSNDSDLKVEIRTASSLSNMQEHDSEHWDDGASDAHLKNESLYRYSDYLDPVFPPKPVSEAWKMPRQQKTDILKVIVPKPLIF